MRKTIKRVVVSAFAMALMAGCSSGGDDGPPPNSMSLQLEKVSDSSGKVTKNAGLNFLDLDVTWLTWACIGAGGVVPDDPPADGEDPHLCSTPSGVTFDADSGTLKIAGDANAGDAVHGVHQYDVPLAPQTTYQFTMGALDTPGAAALIFARDADGQLVALTESVYTIAFTGQPIQFTTPESPPIVSFDIQVQNQWGAPESDAMVAPELNSDPVVVDNLLELAGDWFAWPDWITQTGTPTDATTGADGVVSIPQGDQLFRSVLQPQSLILAAETEYELSVGSCNAGSWCACRLYVDGGTETAFFDTGLPDFPNFVKFTPAQATAVQLLELTTKFGYLDDTLMQCSLRPVDAMPPADPPADDPPSDPPADDPPPSDPPSDPPPADDPPADDPIDPNAPATLSFQILNADPPGDVTIENPGDHIDIDVMTNRPGARIFVKWGGWQIDTDLDENGNMFSNWPPDSWPDEPTGIQFSLYDETDTVILQTTTNPIIVEITE